LSPGKEKGDDKRTVPLSARRKTMNKILYFDCFAGISGDMVVGALLDLGADQDRLYQHLSGLKLSGYHLHIEKQQKLGIWGTDFKVVLEEETHSPPHSASGPHHGHSHAHRGIQEISARTI
jgi:uncharacterized protein (DUF111 family)